MPTLHLLIKGKVQGVFYRATAKRIAASLGIAGWVRNKDDGNVEAMVTGSADQLKQFAHWCRRGPEGAEVTELIETEQQEIIFDSFSVRH